MDNKNRSFRQLEIKLTRAIICATVAFTIFLFASGYGVVWLKIICAIFSILIPTFCFGYLYLAHEWRKKRSQWLVAASIALAICTICSLILRFPSPSP